MSTTSSSRWRWRCAAAASARRGAFCARRPPAAGAAAAAALRTLHGRARTPTQSLPPPSTPLHVSRQDKDLRELRDTREWLDMLTEAKGGLSREQKIKLRTEAKVRR